MYDSGNVMRFIRLMSYAAALLLLGSTLVDAQVEFENVGGDHVAITIDGTSFSNFFYGPAHAKPFLFPVAARRD